MLKRDNPYFAQVELLVRVLPHVAKEKCFALKGGTAINLFHRNLPRLSVDIDLVYRNKQPRQDALVEIHAALERIAKAINTAMPNISAVPSAGRDTTPATTKMNIQTRGAQIKVEVNYNFRGTVFEPEERSVVEAVEKSFGFANMQVASFSDLYAGKMVAALDRQHPRDFFDIMLLFANEGISDELFQAFLVYLLGHDRSFSDVLFPTPKDIEEVFNKEFEGMTVEPIGLDELLEARNQLVREVHRRLGENEKQFLLSVKRLEPDWARLGIPGVQDLPAVRFKLMNLSKMSEDNRLKALAHLEQLFNKA